jgi:hypothetical protein
MIVAVICLTISLIALAVLCVIRASIAEQDVELLREAVKGFKLRMELVENLAARNSMRLDGIDFRFTEVDRLSADTLRQCEKYKNYIYRYIGDPEEGHE